MKLNIQIRIVLMMIIMLSIISIIVFIIVIFFPTNYISWINDITPNPTPRKEMIYLIASIITIASIFFAMYTYYLDRYYKRESKKAIIQNLNAEIEINLGQIKYLKQNVGSVQDLKGPPVWDFDMSYLKESRNILKSKSIRRGIIATIANISQLNSVLDLYRNLSSTAKKNTGKQRLEVPTELFKEIETNLNTIKRHIDVSIDKIIIP